MMKRKKNIKNFPGCFTCFLVAGILSGWLSQPTYGQSSQLPLITSNRGTTDGEFLFFFGGIIQSGSPEMQGQTTVYQPAPTVIMDLNTNDATRFYVDWQILPWDSRLNAPLVHYDKNQKKIYIYGGKISGQAQNSMYTYDPELRTWDQIFPPDPKPGPLDSPVLIGVKDGFVVAGGKGPDRIPSHEVWLYHTLENLWRQLPSLPESSDFYRCVGVPLDESTIMLWGGLGYNDGYNVWTCNTADNEPVWTSVATNPAVQNGPLPLIPADSFVGVSTSADPESGQTRTDAIYMGGGEVSQLDQFKNFYELNIDNWTWEKKPDIPEYRGNAASAFFNSQLFVYGGRSEDYIHYNTLFTYNILTDSWEERAPQVVESPEPIRVSFYVQDTWIISDKLHLTFGIRFDSEKIKGYRLARARGNQMKSGEVEWTIIARNDAQNLQFTDSLDLDGSTWLYRACSYHVAGNSPWSDTLSIVASSAHTGAIPENDFSIVTAFPNPAKDQTTIGIDITDPGKFILMVHSLDGKELLAKESDLNTPGRHQLNLDTSRLRTGIYLVELRSLTHSEFIKIMVD